MKRQYWRQLELRFALAVLPCLASAPDRGFRERQQSCAGQRRERCAGQADSRHREHHRPWSFTA